LFSLSVEEFDEIQTTALPKELIKESLKDAPVRVHAALDGTNHEVPLVALGYHYSQKTILLFIMTKDS